MKRLALFTSLVAVMIALPLAARSQRVATSSTYVLEFGGKQVVHADAIRSATSGTAPTAQPTTASAFQHTTVTAVRQWHSVELAIAWVHPFFSEFFSSESPSPQSARAYALASDGAVRAAQSFANASFTEVRFPEMNARSKSPGRVTALFVGDTAPNAAAAARIEVRPPVDWQSNAYRIEIGNLPCERVSRAQAFTVQRSIPTPTGTTWTRRASSRMEVSNLVLTMPMRDIDPWQDWFRGAAQGSTTMELSGSMEYLDASLRSAILTVELEGIGIVSLQPNQIEDNHEQIAVFTVTLSVRSVRVR